MNKTDLIRSLSEETAVRKGDVTLVLEALARIIGRTLKNDDKVQWSGLGTFTVSRRPARKGINPVTKERIDLPASVVPKFKPGKHLKEVIRSVR